MSEIDKLKFDLKMHKFKIIDNVSAKCIVSFTYKSFKLSVIDESSDVEKLYKVAIHDYNGYEPLNHVRLINKEGLLCLDSKVNKYVLFAVPNREDVQVIKDILDEKNIIEDSFNDLHINMQRVGCETITINDFDSKKYFQVDIDLKNSITIKSNLTIDLPKWIRKKCRGVNNRFIIKINNGNRWRKIFVDNDKIKFVYDYTTEKLISKTGTKMNNKLAIVVGVGSLGSEICEQLRLGGVTKFILIDNDTFSRTNFYRWFAPIPEVLDNYNKTILIQTMFTGEDKNNSDENSNIKVFALDNKIEEIEIATLNDAIGNFEFDDLLIINSTANSDVDVVCAKKFQNIDINKAKYYQIFLEENGLSSHVVYIENIITDGIDSLISFANKYNENDLQISKSLKENVHEEGCVGETQIYSQNASKISAIQFVTGMNNIVSGHNFMINPLHEIYKNIKFGDGSLVTKLTVKGAKELENGKY